METCYWKRYFILLCVSFFLFNIPITYSQDVVTFEKHGWKKNTLAGHSWRWEFPLDCRFRVGGKDGLDDYAARESKVPHLFGVGVKYALKNNLDRGIGFGLGMDYTTNNTFRYNLFLDLDFLFHFIAFDGKKMILGESVLSNYVFSTMISEVDGVKRQEFYLTLSFLQIHFLNFSLSMSYNKGVLRNKYPSYLGQESLYYCISYRFSTR